MKLASLKNGTRDGKLVVVSRDLTRYTDASFLVPTLQAALENWPRIAPHLEAMAESLEHGSVPSERFHEHEAASPLPRAYQSGDGAGVFAGPRDAVSAASDVIVSAGVAAVLGDLPAGSSSAEANDAVALVMLSATSASGQSAFSPVAVTVDELDGAWSGGALSAPLSIQVGSDNSSKKLEANLAVSAASAASGHPLAAGAIIIGKVEGGLNVKSGATVRIEMKDKSGHSIFGAIVR